MPELFLKRHRRHRHYPSPTPFITALAWGLILGGLLALVVMNNT